MRDSAFKGCRHGADEGPGGKPVSRWPAPAQVPIVPKPGTLGRRVYDGLERLLADTDTYPPGTKLPTYRALCQQYGVAQAAVGAAMEALASQGRVCIRPPQGVYVLDEDHEPVPTKSVLIATAVRERIADGTFKPGTPLVPVLAREFEVDASTVTSALRPLAEEGLVVTKIGSGTYVSPRRPPEPDHRVYPPNPGPTQTTDPATLALRAPSDRNGVRTTSSESSPAVSPHLIGTSSRLHAARAAYQGVVDMLADTDTYPPGSKLPAHPVLADRLGVTSSALRIAMHALAADGRVHRRHSGTVVLGKDSTPVPVPTTTRLTEIVRERIQDGTIKPGQLIATALRAEFGVGNTTVRSALTPLISEGLLVAKQGVGIYASAGTASDDEPPARATPSQITEIVRKRIQDGTFKPGEPLTIRLLEELGVGRTKLQGCLAPLVNEGLLVARQGVGTYVPHPPTETTARTCPGKADTTRRTTDAARPRTRAADQ